MTIRRSAYTIACAVLSTAWGAAGAQNCLGVPLAPARHSLGLTFSGPSGAMGEGDEGALGLSYAGARRDARALRLDLATRAIIHENASSTIEDFVISRLSGTLAEPLKKREGASANSGWCRMAQVATAITRSYSSEEELGRAPSPAAFAYSGAVGAAWAVSTPSSAFYAGPLVGMSAASGQTAPFVTMHAGGGVLLGRLLLNGEINAPLGSEGAKNTFRFGWTW
jgi:hypothetical protein